MASKKELLKIINHLQSHVERLEGDINVLHDETMCGDVSEIDGEPTLLGKVDAIIEHLNLDITAEPSKLVVKVKK